ncbi:MAG TPA: hypothetical protein VE631_07825 [Alphaproteobacteria bacterium]|jgi:hypothetical protein|nr:hypothetical protein [Alphaproteobacteria bacterium]
MQAMTAICQPAPQADADGFDVDGIDVPTSRLPAMRRRVRGSNIDEETLLATDYLNHFNEIVMLLDLVAEMPECLADVRKWRPKSYARHFRDSGLSIAALAIEAYAAAPARYRAPFDALTAEMDALIAMGRAEIDAVADAGDAAAAGALAAELSATLQKLIDRAGALVHGDRADEEAGAAPAPDEPHHTMDQSEIDALFD